MVKMARTVKTVNQVVSVAPVRQAHAVWSALQAQLVNQVPRVAKDAKVKMASLVRMAAQVTWVSAVKKEDAVRREKLVTPSRENRESAVYPVSLVSPVLPVWLVLHEPVDLECLVSPASVRQSVNRSTRWPSLPACRVTATLVVRPSPSTQS